MRRNESRDKQLYLSPTHPHPTTPTRAVEKMNKMTPAEFEQVLHPIFQEDELTLILAGKD